MGSTASVSTDWVATLRARGYRLTPQRQLVLEAVGRLGHGTPEEIAAAVQSQVSGVNISTVYRTLELLEQLEMVQHTHLGHGAPTYSIADDHQHVHLKCRDCQCVEEVPPAMFDDVAAAVLADRGFRIDVGHFAVFGTCAACAARTAEPSTRSGTPGTG